MMAVVCKNVKCKFPYHIDPKAHQWREVVGPPGTNGKPKRLWVASVLCPTCNTRSDQSRQRRP